MAPVESHERRAAQALRRARELVGLTQPAFAARLGVELGERFSRVAIGNWETGRHRVPAAVLLAAASIAGVSVEGLLGADVAGAEPGYSPEEARLAIETVAAIRLLLR